MTNNFFHRWSERKLRPETEPVKTDSTQAIATTEEAPLGHTLEVNSDNIATEALTDTPYTDQSSLIEVIDGEELSIANLLTSGADKHIKKAALRKLFMNGEFNQLDGLSDTNLRIANVKPLAPEIAEKVRGWTNNKLEEMISQEPIDEKFDDRLLIAQQTEVHVSQCNIAEENIVEEIKVEEVIVEEIIAKNISTEDESSKI